MADHDNNMNHDALSLSYASVLKSSLSLHSTKKVPTDDDFITELTHQMSQFMLQEEDIEDSLDFSSIASHTHTSNLSWDSTVSPDSTLWSPVSCNQGSSEGSSQDSSPPATPCWKTKTYAHVVSEFENTMKLNKERATSSKHNHGSMSSNMDVLSSHKALVQEQIKAIEVRKKHNISDIKQQQQQQQHDRLPRPTPLQTGGGCMMQAVFLGGSGSRSGTGVFLPRAGTVAPSESTKKKGKGCSTVLIPARVVQALQLHFDKTAPKVVGFPPLRDLVLSHGEGMFSLENQQSTKAATDVQSDMILPNEWTY